MKIVMTYAIIGQLFCLWHLRKTEIVRHGLSQVTQETQPIVVTAALTAFVLTLFWPIFILTDVKWKH